MNLEIKDFNIYKALKIADESVDVASMLLMVIGLIGSVLLFVIMFISWEYDSRLFRALTISMTLWMIPTYLTNKGSDEDDTTK